MEESPNGFLVGRESSSRIARLFRFCFIDCVRESGVRTLFEKMSLTYQIGDATQPESDGPKIIVHVCNDGGGWGKGFVVAVSKRWREPERCYRAWHRGEGDQPFKLGQVQFVQVEPDIWVANLIGQHGMGSRSGQPPVRYDAVREGLRSVASKDKERCASVHMPRIACGLAGGKWEEVERIVCEELTAAGIATTVYDLPQRQTVVRRLTP